MSDATRVQIDRRAVGEALTRVAFAVELLDWPGVNAAAASGLAWTIRQLDGDVTYERIAAMPDASVPILAVIDDIAHGRKPPLLEELEARVPPGLFEVRKLKGLGPKKIAALWKQLDITSLGELEYACQESRLVELKGFGKKTQDSVLEQIEALRAQAGMVRLDQALTIGRALSKALEADGARAHIVGDVRRGMELIREVAVITTAPADMARKALALFGGEVSDLAADALRTRVGPIDVVVHAAVAPTRWGTALVVHTGSAAHVELLRKRAAHLDTIEAADEDAFYAALTLLTPVPERREANVPLMEKGHARPKLVTRDDLRGALHNHTTESDGVATLVEMRDAAAARGLTYLGITDHSVSAVYAKGLATTTLANQRADIAKLNGDGTAQAATCTLVTGVESDIKKDGALDYDDDVLRRLEVVVASVHARYGQKGDDLTNRMVAAAKHPLTDIVGHPTGRLLLGRAPSEYDVAALLDACAASGCAVELNANPARLDLNEVHLDWAKERGIPVSIAADAHSTGALDHLDYGVTIARRAGLTAEDVLNARTLDELRAWLSARRARALA
jgi:DNA polymerase (family 10)